MPSVLLPSLYNLAQVAMFMGFYLRTVRVQAASRLHCHPAQPCTASQHCTATQPCTATQLMCPAAGGCHILHRGC